MEAKGKKLFQFNFETFNVLATYLEGVLWVVNSPIDILLKLVADADRKLFNKDVTINSECVELEDF